VVPDSKGASNKIAKDRSASANSASVKNEAVGANKAAVAANRAAASKADDKISSLRIKQRREVNFPPLFYVYILSENNLEHITSSFFCATRFSHFPMLFG